MDKVFRITVLILSAIVLNLSAAWGTTTTISSLPYTANQTGTAYSETLIVNGTKVTGTGSGINFTGHDIVFNLMGDTIAFGSNNGDSYYGFYFASSSYNIRVINGVLLHVATNDTIPDGCKGIQFQQQSSIGPHDIFFQDLRVVVTGDNANCVYDKGGSGVYNISFSRCIFTSNSQGFSNRCNYDGAVVVVDAYSTSGTHDIKFDSCTITPCPAQGFANMGHGASFLTRTIINACTVTVDQRNRLDIGGACGGTGNAYAILLRFSGPGSRITNNYIRSGTTYEGGEGIMTENPMGTISTPIIVSGNDVDVHCGNSVRPEYRTCYARKSRSIDSGGQIYNMDDYNNRYVTTGDTVAATDSYENIIVGLVIGGDPGTNVSYHDNYISASQFGSSGGVTSRALVLDCSYGDSTDYEGEAKIYENHFYSDAFLMVSGGANCGGDYLRLWADSLDWISPRLSVTSTFRHNYWDITKTSFGNDLYYKDFVYGTGVYDSNITWATDANHNDETGLQRTLSILVLGSNSQPVPSADVIAKNNYGATVLTTTTNENGIATGAVTYWFEHRTHTGDSTGFNPFTLIASKGADADTGTLTVDWDSFTDTLTLGATSGEADETPPVISNIAVSLITSSTARITWTTDEAATDTVNYGLTASYGSNETVAGYRTSHIVDLINLLAGSTYHYRVRSEDASHNKSVSADSTFVTDAEPVNPDTVEGQYMMYLK